MKNTELVNTKNSWTKDEIESFEEITKDLCVEDPNSILNYGSDLRNAAEQAADSLLKTTNSGDSGDIGVSLNNLLSRLGSIKLDDPGQTSKWKRSLCKRVPFLKSIIVNYKKLVSQYESVGTIFDNIKEDVRSIKLETMEANNSLKVMYDSSEAYKNEIDKLVEAGEYKLSKFREELKNYSPESREYQSILMFCNSLERDLQTKKSQSFSLTNTMKLIIIMSGDNQMVCQKADRIMSVTIPDMKNQANVAIRAIKLTYCSDVIEGIDGTAEKLLKETTQNVHDVSVKLAKQNMSEDINTSTLLEAMKTTSSTVEEMLKIFREDNKKSAENLKLLEVEQRRMNNNIISTKEQAKLLEDRKPKHGFID